MKLILSHVHIKRHRPACLPHSFYSELELAVLTQVKRAVVLFRLQSADLVVNDAPNEMSPHSFYQ